MQRFNWRPAVLAGILTAFLPAAMAETVVANVDELEGHDGERIIISGVVSSVESGERFALADRTGTIHVYLKSQNEDLEPGNFVTVSGEMDESFFNEIKSAEVTILDDRYDGWYNSYYETYRSYYDHNAFDAETYESTESGSGDVGE